MPRDMIKTRRRIERRRVESLRPGGDGNKSPTGSPIGHTQVIPNTDVRTLTKRIQVGDIFSGVVPRRHGVETAHFKIVATPLRNEILIRIRVAAQTRPSHVWIARDDLELAIKTGLATHVIKAPFEI